MEAEKASTRSAPAPIAIAPSTEEERCRHYDEDLFVIGWR